jgi:hypothetical protein
MLQVTRESFSTLWRNVCKSFTNDAKKMFESKMNIYQFSQKVFNKETASCDFFSFDKVQEVDTRTLAIFEMEFFCYV